MQNMNHAIRESTPEYQAVARYAGEEIRLAEATAITGISRVTIWRWARRIPPLIRHRTGPVVNGKKTILLNKADVLYCAKAHALRAKDSDTVQGHLVFDKDGLPFKPKNGKGRH
jgi:hypothetical protein